ncbi:hypothetical protein PVK06_001802 [Gossypium arboreum]|uniref:Uncharacterized protein n=1 Tax=Gossypium arboreum TaxID=29729 RepID=A0ABR0R1Z6_GOSAR|nr:hypothetical protein PVK06_001802 [Gossypium arboreum]
MRKRFQESTDAPKNRFYIEKSNYIDFMACIRKIAEALDWELFCEKRPSPDE